MFNDFKKKETNAKVVYYGIGLGGKTTNVKQLELMIPEENRSQLATLNTEGDRTLFFDFLAHSVEIVKGWKLRVHIYSVPGQTHYKSSRKKILRGVDAVVLVADSQEELIDGNLAARGELAEFLIEEKKNILEMPYVLQLNKRDLPNVAPVQTLSSILRFRDEPVIEAVAAQGIGVMETNDALLKLMIEHARNGLNI